MDPRTRSRARRRPAPRAANRPAKRRSGLALGHAPVLRAFASAHAQTPRPRMRTRLPPGARPRSQPRAGCGSPPLPRGSPAPRPFPSHAPRTPPARTAAQPLPSSGTPRAPLPQPTRGIATAGRARPPRGAREGARGTTCLARSGRRARPPTGPASARTEMPSAKESQPETFSGPTTRATSRIFDQGRRPDTSAASTRRVGPRLHESERSSASSPAPDRGAGMAGVSARAGWRWRELALKRTEASRIAAPMPTALRDRAKAKTTTG
jgi:hypothetical protein